MKFVKYQNVRLAILLLGISFEPAALLKSNDGTVPVPGEGATPGLVHDHLLDLGVSGPA